MSVEGRQASIEAGVCVHARIESATCQACVAVCPQRALHLDDEGLTLDTACCDGCGLCVAACPTAAIAAPRGEPIQQLVSRRRVLLAACEHALPEAGEGRMTCLHAVSVSDLLRHWQRGEHVWLVLTADCAACPRGRGEGFKTRVERINTLLQTRGEPPIQVKAITTAQWQHLRQGQSQVRHDRRSFIGRLLQRPVGAITGQSPTEESRTDRQPPGLYLTGQGSLPWAIRIDPKACVACHACCRVCPTEALRLELDTTAGTAARYRLLHECCTGCGICSDVCNFQAIRLLPWSRPEQEDLPLRTFRCKACGADCYAPTIPETGGGICWVCLRNRTARRRYQVLEE